MPKLARGQYPLKACIHWYVAYWRDRALGRSEDDSKRRKSAAEAQLWEAKARQSTGDLIERAEIVAAWTTIAMRLGKAFETLPNNLGREFNWSPEVVRSVRASLDDFRRTFVRDSAEFLEVTDEARGATEAA